jgi:hypothetical protein
MYDIRFFIQSFGSQDVFFIPLVPRRWRDPLVIPLHTVIKCHTRYVNAPSPQSSSGPRRHQSVGRAIQRVLSSRTTRCATTSCETTFAASPHRVIARRHLHVLNAPVVDGPSEQTFGGSRALLHW